VETGSISAAALRLDVAKSVASKRVSALEDLLVRRGVGQHPHRGFETVTIVYTGEGDHRDSTGGGGSIGPGDVQWMTAGAGIVHEEHHGSDFAKHGGPFEMIQLWVNLPAKDKLTQPHYQNITSAQIARVVLPDDGQPLNEPVVGHGPFVMNTTAQIEQAFVDYQSGRMGRIEVADA
jgi:redox-sensitive bicupin YhaK (pirin superfamily)